MAQVLNQKRHLAGSSTSHSSGREEIAFGRPSAAVSRNSQVPWRLNSPVRRFYHSCAVLLLAFARMAAMGQSTAPPALISPAPGSVLAGPSVTFTWTADSNATQYKLRLGSEPKNSGDLGVYTAGRASAASVSVRATGLPTNGEIGRASCRERVSECV